jgi:hypothetical protein
MNERLIKASKELTAKEQYMHMLAQGTKKMSDHKGEVIEVKSWCLYESTEEKTDPKSGEISSEVKEVLTIHTADGDTLGTISDTFKRDFFDMQDFFKAQGMEAPNIKIIGGVSKKDREFITCTIED